MPIIFKPVNATKYPMAPDVTSSMLLHQLKVFTELVERYPEGRELRKFCEERAKLSRVFTRFSLNLFNFIQINYYH